MLNFPMQSNLRYKTMLCRHFMNGFCQAGPNCQFAHGDHEKRNINDPSPGGFPVSIQMPMIQQAPVIQQNSMMMQKGPIMHQVQMDQGYGLQGISPSNQFNFKTQICKYFQNGYCKNFTCSFAHGLSELQSALNMQAMNKYPQAAQQQSIMFSYPIPNLLVDMQQQTKPPIIQNSRPDKKDILRDLMFRIVTHLEYLFSQNQEVLFHLRTAKEGLKNYNFAICSEMLTMIISDPSRTRLEIETYGKIYNEAQEIIKKNELD